jgi:two-component system phosphate regulon sensor histidine kinase PhoR
LPNRIFSFEENLPKIFGDRYQIRQVIENLLDNAIRYSKGKGMVKIKIKKEKNSVYFEIEDNGVGIPKEDQKFIFQKFFRASNVLKISKLKEPASAFTFQKQ